jgi:4-amino-4-deoxy-L-arabinose transferase-like glycosyltransferase
VTGITNKLLILFIMPLFLYVGLLPVAPLMEPDEGRYSLIPSSMNISGDYITPRLKEAVFIDKPPLVYWATALSFKIFGENEFSSRLFAGLCAWGCILLVYNMGRFLQDEKAGLYGAAVLTTSLFHFAIGRINIMDMPVAFFLSLAIWSGYRYCAAAGRKEWLYLCYLASALAFLAKGLMGIIFPAVARYSEACLAPGDTDFSGRFSTLADSDPTGPQRFLQIFFRAGTIPAVCHDYSQPLPTGLFLSADYYCRNAALVRLPV